MTTYFYDSSALIKRYITETGTAWVRRMTLSSAGHKIVLAKITSVEMVSALIRRNREGSISMRTAHAARLYIDRHTRREYRIITLSDDVVLRAEDLLERHILRAYDAVQLASALSINFQLTAAGLPPLIFVAADQRLLLAADTEGLPIEDPNTD